jgi:hypothetical protein
VIYRICIIGLLLGLIVEEVDFINLPTGCFIKKNKKRKEIFVEKKLLNEKL